MGNRGMNQHSERFLKKSILFHRGEVIRLQDENRRILLGEYQFETRTTHTRTYEWKKIGLNNKKIEKHISIQEKYEKELLDVYGQTCPESGQK